MIDKIASTFFMKVLRIRFTKCMELLLWILRNF